MEEMSPINMWDVIALLGLLVFLLPPWLSAIIVSPLVFHMWLRYENTRRSKRAAQQQPPEPV